MRTLSDMLVKRAIDLFEEGNWKVRKVLAVNPNDQHRTLAECDCNGREITLYPRVIGHADPPLGRSFLHEILGHLLLQYGGTDLEEQEVEWWERRVWRNMSQTMRERLLRLIDAPGT